MLENIPLELRQLKQWVLWRYVEKNGVKTKVPFSVIGVYASVTDEKTWETFEKVNSLAQYYDGIGFVLTKNDPYTIIDLDNKETSPCTEEQLKRHSEIFESIRGYCERSVSGSGVHIVVKGWIPAGIHKENIEIYSHSRYMVFTGDVIRNEPIVDQQLALNFLWEQLGNPQESFVTPQELLSDSSLDDSTIFKMAAEAVNRDKFNNLWIGNWQGEYPSQSEADYALLSMFAFYSTNDNQVRRLFRESELGKREKAIKNDVYLNRSLEKIRNKESAQIIDFTEFKKNLEKIQENGQENKNYEIKLPPGIVGELTVYFYETAVRPVWEVALAASIGILAGIVGRSYNISNTGLNQYLVLLARTGSGKEGGLTGIDNLIKVIRSQIPAIENYIGPAAFASGQALIKTLDKQACFISVLGEFGITLQQICDKNASSHQLMLKKVLLDLYSKSGWTRTLRSSVYSDSEKNTKVIQAPNLTILGESTPEGFFEGLNSNHIAEGLIPRFIVIEYKGMRPSRNKVSGFPPSMQLAQKFADLSAIAISINSNNQCTNVSIDKISSELLDNFDLKADKEINNSKNEIITQLWNRAHLKALKLAALISVGINPHQPIITKDSAEWAIEFIENEIFNMINRFTDGNVGQGDSKQLFESKRIIKDYVKNKSKDEKIADLQKEGIITYTYLHKRVSGLSCFKNDRLGSTNAFKKCIDVLINSGILIQLKEFDLRKNFKYTGIAYQICKLED